MCIGRVLDDVWTTVTGHRSEQSPVIGPNRHQVSGETVASSVIWESPNTRTFQMSFPAVRDRYVFLSFGVLPEKCQYCISRCMDNSHQLRDKTGRRDLGNAIRTATTLFARSALRTEPHTNLQARLGPRKEVLPRSTTRKRANSSPRRPCTTRSRGACRTWLGRNPWRRSLRWANSQAALFWAGG